MWQQRARCFTQFGRRFSSASGGASAPRARVAAATTGVVLSSGAAAWFATNHHSKATRCETDAVALGAAVLGGALVGAGGCWMNMKGKAQAEKDKYSTYWPRNIMMLFGAPGAGKGTQGPKITDTLGLPQLSTGDMLRDAVANQTAVGKMAKEVMASGGLVSDEIVIGIIAERIQQEDCGAGFILDGFPRTSAQALALDKLLQKNGECVNLVMAFDVDASVLEERVCGRWMHKSSGRSYHVKFAPPKSMKVDGNGKPIPTTMNDDSTGEPLYQRSDDTAEALGKRLDSYRSSTVPILTHYESRGIVKNIDGGQPIEKVTKSVLAALKKDH